MKFYGDKLLHRQFSTILWQFTRYPKKVQAFEQFLQRSLGLKNVLFLFSGIDEISTLTLRPCMFKSSSFPE